MIDRDWSLNGSSGDRIVVVFLSLFHCSCLSSFFSYLFFRLLIFFCIRSHYLCIRSRFLSLDLCLFSSCLPFICLRLRSDSFFFFLFLMLNLSPSLSSSFLPLITSLCYHSFTLHQHLIYVHVILFFLLFFLFLILHPSGFSLSCSIFLTQFFLSILHLPSFQLPFIHFFYFFDYSVFIRSLY